MSTPDLSLPPNKITTSSWVTLFIFSATQIFAGIWVFSTNTSELKSINSQIINLSSKVDQLAATTNSLALQSAADREHMRSIDWRLDMYSVPKK